MSFLGGLFNGAGTANKYLRGAMDMRNQTLGQISGEYAPYTENAGAQQQTLNSLLGIGGGGQEAIDTLHAMPGYQSGLQEGVHAIDSSQAAKGLAGSGATLKALDQYGQNYADKNFQQYFGDLSSLSGQSLGATNNLAQAQIGTGNANAQSWSQIGENKANQSNAQLGMLGNVLSGGFKLFGG